MREVGRIREAFVNATHVFSQLPKCFDEAMAAVTLELKKRAKQTKSVYIARTAVT